MTRAAACFCLALLAGCGTTSAPEAPSPGITTGAGVFPAPGAVSTAAISTGSASSPAGPALSGFSVERRTWGGMCPGGPCQATLLVVGDGRWSLVTQAVRTSGILRQDEVAALARAVIVTRLDQTTGTPDCAADHDGTSVSYTWTVAGRRLSTSSCDHPIPRSDPFVIEVERLAARLAP